MLPSPLCWQSIKCLEDGAMKKYYIQFQNNSVSRLPNDSQISGFPKNFQFYPGYLPCILEKIRPHTSVKCVGSIHSYVKTKDDHKHNYDQDFKSESGTSNVL